MASVFPGGILAQPVVPQDASRQDTFATAAAALKALVNVTDAVFNRIQERVNQEGSRLNSLNQRIAKVRQSVGQISSTTRPATIFSATKYPATEVAHQATYLSLYSGPSAAFPPSLDESLAPTNGGIPLVKADIIPDEEVNTRPEKRAAVLDLLAHLSLKNPNKISGSGYAMRSQMATGSRYIAPEAGNDDEDGQEGADATAARGAKARRGADEGGLGALPANLTSVSSMLLFNTKENPYQEYKTIDDLVSGSYGETAAELLRAEAVRTTRATAAARAADEARKLGAAPVTVLEGDTTTLLAQVEYTYKPKMQDIGQFELPSHLALPNVADMAWSAGQAGGVIQSIAPSVVRAGEAQLPTIYDLQPSLAAAASALPDLPNVAPSAVAIPSASQLPSNVPIPVVLPDIALPTTMQQPPMQQQSVQQPMMMMAANPAAAGLPMQAQMQMPFSSSATVSAEAAGLGSLSAFDLPNLPSSVQYGDSLDASGSAASDMGGNSGAGGDASVLPPPPPSLPSPAPRAGLLAALSDPNNMNRLKKREPKEKSEDDGPSPASSSSSGGGKASGMSLLDALAARFANRRKEISGNPGAGASSSSSSAGSSKPAGQTLQDMLPPLPSAGGAAAPGNNRLPPLPSLSTPTSTGAASSSESSASSNSMFNPNAMHGFKAFGKSSSKKKRRDSDDDFPSDSDDDDD